MEVEDLVKLDIERIKDHGFEDIEHVKGFILENPDKYYTISHVFDDGVILLDSRELAECEFYEEELIKVEI